MVGTQADPRSRRWRTAATDVLAAPHDRLTFRFRAPDVVMAQQERQLRLLYPEMAGEHAPLIERSARARSATPTWSPAYPELGPNGGLWALAALSFGGAFLLALWMAAVAFAL